MLTLSGTVVKMCCAVVESSVYSSVSCSRVPLFGGVLCCVYIFDSMDEYGVCVLVCTEDEEGSGCEVSRRG